MTDKILLWRGSMGIFDPRGQKTLEAFTRILDKAEVEYIYVEEKDTSEHLRLAGDEYTFEQIARENITTIQRSGISTIVTPCPHSYTILKNDYKDFGGDFEVIHHTEYLLELIRSARLKPKTSLQGTDITYHDPCRLSRIGMTVAAREILKLLGANIIEPKHHGMKSLCCGGGGYFSQGDIPRRVSSVRLNELKATGCKSIAVSCPYCMAMLDSAAENTPVMDVCELVQFY